MFGNSFPFEHQLDTMDCGPACLKMIARHFGKFYSLQHVWGLNGVLHLVAKRGYLI